MFFETPLFALLATLLGVVVGVLVIIFVLVPVFRGLGWAIGGVFQGIGYLIHQPRSEELERQMRARG